MATTIALPAYGFTSQQQVVASPAPRLSETSLQISSSTVSEINLEDHMPMVRAVARRMHRTLPRHIELDDLISAGYLGLVDAAQKFEQSRQTHFRGYAEFRVRGAILDSLRELDWGTRSLRRKVRAIEQARKTLVHSLERAPEDADLAKELGISIGDLRETLIEARTVEMESLQAEREDAEGLDLLSSLVDTTAHDALTLYLEGEFKQSLIAAIDGLPERDRLVITLSFYEELTLKEIGDLLGLTVSRVSQIRSGAIKKLQTVLNPAR